MRHRVGIVIGALASVLVVASGVARAAEDPDRDLRDLSLEELMQIEVPTVVGASKRAQKVTDAPSAVTIVTADEIRKFGHRTLADILRSVRGLYVSYDRTYGYIGVRGFNRPGDFGGRVLLLVDGHRLNEPLFDSAFNMTDFLLDVDLIDHVEVVRGPGSVLYGNNAFFAVVNVVSRNGAGIGGLEAAVSAGSYDTYQGRATVGKSFANGVDVMLSATGYGSHGSPRVRVPGFEATDGDAAMNFDADEYWSTYGSARWRGFSIAGGYIRRQKDSPNVPFGTRFNDRRQHPIDSRGYVSLGWDGILGAWSSTVRTYYDYYGLEVDYPFVPDDAADPAQTTVNRERDRAQWIGLEGQVSRSLFEKHRLTFGTELRYDFDLQLQSWDDQPFSAVSKLDTTAHREGVFAQGEIAVLDRLTLVVGGRYDHYSEFGDTLNPRAALIYRPMDTMSLKLLYGHAYRAPSVFERDYVNPDSKANPDLKAERIQTLEGVYEHYLPANVRVSASGFWTRAKGLATQTTDPSDGKLVYSNADDAETKGIELESEYRPAGGWLARASYTLQRTEDSNTGTRVSNSPMHLVKGSLIAPLWRQQLFAGAEVQYTSTTKTIPDRETEHADPYVIANLTLTARDFVKGLEVQGSIYNLFDERYAYPASDEYRSDVLPQDGRTFRLKLVFRY